MVDKLVAELLGTRTASIGGALGAFLPAELMRERVGRLRLVARTAAHVYAAQIPRWQGGDAVAVAAKRILNVLLNCLDD